MPWQRNLAGRGAKVILVSGPTHLKVQHQNIEYRAVESASEMYAQCQGVFKDCDIAILAAAVADYAPLKFSEGKIKKKPGMLTLELRQTIDIAESLGKLKQPHQILRRVCVGN